ncbi:endonuclease V [Pedosphaera parvula]|uniref:Endonuclease V (Deoxyinosine 3endonuclease) n=1 Tax=Pedosphaera parvula (strain Ellin514) TaxID=320771 RepID=B9XHJ4_PEDPL|nr:endonuclease V [Pedosphaera parvula]EEF60829.1 endonuclease V (deoxyinosine 3endonuclease) [Pedosphaera parvula Ellin514]
MIACLDVHYEGATAFAAGIVFQEWVDAFPYEEEVIEVSNIQPYQPGQFYLRELPCLLAVLKALPAVQTVIIDGYVWLDNKGKPGLGAHLHQALNEKIPVIGVAKTPFQGADGSCELLRGKSKRPLYITAAGMDPGVATQYIRSMHGQFRIPTLLKRVDQLARTHRFS